MKYLKLFTEERDSIDVNEKRSISDEDDSELVNIFQSLTDIGFSLDRYKNERYIGTQYILKLRISPEKDLLGRNDSISYYVGGYNHECFSLNTDFLVSRVEELDKNPKFEMVDDDVLGAVYETLDRIGDSKFKVIYFEMRLENMGNYLNKLVRGEAEIYIFFQITN